MCRHNRQPSYLLFLNNPLHGITNHDMKFYPLLLLFLFINVPIQAQNHAGCSETATCVKRKNLYIDYSKFTLVESEDFNAPKNANAVKYLTEKGWEVGAFKNNKSNNTDSISMNAIAMDGNDLIIKAINWQKDKTYPSYQVGIVHKQMESLLGMYEMRVKVSEHPGIVSTGWFWWSYRYEFDIFEYVGKHPYKIPINSWAFFPHDEDMGYTTPYTDRLCDAYTPNTILGDIDNNYKPFKVEYDERYKKDRKYFHTKKCYCQKFYCMKKPLYEAYHTFQYVVTPTEAAVFLDGVLIGVSALGGNDNRSVCPLTEKECRVPPLAVLGIGVVPPHPKNPNHEDNRYRKALKDQLDNGLEIEYRVDYFRKYDFKSEADYPSYVKEYMNKTALTTKEAPARSPKLGTQKITTNDNGWVAYLTKNNKFYLSKNIKATKGKVNNKITAFPNSDIVLSNNNDLFFVHSEGYLVLANVDDSLNITLTEALGGEAGVMPKIAVTPFRDIVSIENKGLTEVYVVTENQTIGRFINFRSKWFFQDITTANDIKVAGDIAVNSSGLVAYRGEDGNIHAVKAAGKSDNIKKMEMKDIVPSVSTDFGTIAVTEEGNIIFITDNNHLGLLQFRDGEYWYEWLNGPFSNDCERAYGSLALYEDEMSSTKRLFYRGEGNNVLSFTKSSFWYVDWIDQPFNLARSTQRKVFSTSRFWRFLRGYEQSDIVVSKNNEVYFFDKNRALQSYELQSSGIDPNNPNYAPYTDEIEECTGTENTHHSFTSIESMPLEYFYHIQDWKWFDALGQPIPAYAFTSKDAALAAEIDLPKGIYFIKIKHEDGEEMVKFVKT